MAFNQLMAGQPKTSGSWTPDAFKFAVAVVNMRIYLVLSAVWSQMSWVQPRVLTLEQAAGLKARLDAWISKVGTAATTLEQQQLNVLV